MTDVSSMFMGKESIAISITYLIVANTTGYVMGCRTPYRRTSSSSETETAHEGADYAYRGDPRLPSASQRTGIWFEEPYVSGRLSPTAVARTASRHLPEIRRCRRRAELETKSRLSGRTVFEMNIASDGTLTSVRIRETNLHDRDVRRCLLEAVSSWRMPETHGTRGATVQLPLNIRPSSRKE